MAAKIENPNLMNKDKDNFLNSFQACLSAAFNKSLTI